MKSRERSPGGQKLLNEIHKILNEDINNTNYGANRMLIALEQKGIKTSLSSVRRAMRKGNLAKRNRRSPDGLTKADKKRCNLKTF